MKENEETWVTNEKISKKNEHQENGESIKPPMGIRTKICKTISVTW